MASDYPISKEHREALKAIHRITVDRRREGDRRVGARNGELANQLGVSPGTVTARLKSLAERGLIEYESHQVATLTEDGMREATRAIRRHRLVESLLHLKLGFTGDEADRYAPTFEHDLPDDVEHRIEEVLGFPKTCPHGYSIPAPVGKKIPPMETLYQVSPTTNTQMKELSA